MRTNALLASIFVVGCAPRYVQRPAPAAQCEPAEGTGELFDRGAAAKNSSVDISSCRRPGVEPADGRIQMLFCPGDGVVHATSMIEDPFDDETRKCIEERFHSVRVPPFSGKPVHVKRAVHLR